MASHDKNIFSRFKGKFNLAKKLKGSYEVAESNQEVGVSLVRFTARNNSAIIQDSAGNSTHVSQHNGSPKTNAVESVKKIPKMKIRSPKIRLKSPKLPLAKKENKDKLQPSSLDNGELMKCNDTYATIGDNDPEQEGIHSGSHPHVMYQHGVTQIQNSPKNSSKQKQERVNILQCENNILDRGKKRDARHDPLPLIGARNRLDNEHKEGSKSVEGVSNPQHSLLDEADSNYNIIPSHREMRLPEDEFERVEEPEPGYDIIPSQFKNDRSAKEDPSYDVIPARKVDTQSKLPPVVSLGQDIIPLQTDHFTRGQLFEEAFEEEEEAGYSSCKEARNMNKNNLKPVNKVSVRCPSDLEGIYDAPSYATPNKKRLARHCYDNNFPNLVNSKNIDGAVKVSPTPISSVKTSPNDLEIVGKRHSDGITPGKVGTIEGTTGMCDNDIDPQDPGYSVSRDVIPEKAWGGEHDTYDDPNDPGYTMTNDNHCDINTIERNKELACDAEFGYATAKDLPTSQNQGDSRMDIDSTDGRKEIKASVTRTESEMEDPGYMKVKDVQHNSKIPEHKVHGIVDINTCFSQLHQDHTRSGGDDIDDLESELGYATIKDTVVEKDAKPTAAARSKDANVRYEHQGARPKVFFSNPNDSTRTCSHLPGSNLHGSTGLKGVVNASYEDDDADSENCLQNTRQLQETSQSSEHSKSNTFLEDRLCVAYKSPNSGTHKGQGCTVSNTDAYPVNENEDDYASINLRDKARFRDGVAKTTASGDQPCSPPPPVPERKYKRSSGSDTEDHNPPPIPARDYSHTEMLHADPANQIDEPTHVTVEELPQQANTLGIKLPQIHSIGGATNQTEMFHVDPANQIDEPTHVTLAELLQQANTLGIKLPQIRSIGGTTNQTNMAAANQCQQESAEESTRTFLHHSKSPEMERRSFKEKLFAPKTGTVERGKENSCEDQQALPGPSGEQKSQSDGKVKRSQPHSEEEPPVIPPRPPPSPRDVGE